MDRSFRARLAAIPLLLAVTAGALTNNVVAVPLVQISHELDIEVSAGALLITASTLGLAVFMPLAGWMADRFGHRRILVLCLSSFLLSVVGAALAPTFNMLLLCRLWQGLSLAVVPPAVMRVLPELFATTSRGKALGLWAAANGVGQALAPPLGGLVADAFGWRAIFWGMIPIIVVTLGLMFFVPQTDSDPQPKSFDLKGSILLSLGIAGLLTLLSLQANDPGHSLGFSLLAGITGVGALVLFPRHIRSTRNPFVPPALFRSVSFVSSSFSGYVQMFCLTIVMLATPIYLTAAEVSLSETGLILLTVTLAMAGLAPFTGALTARLGYRVVIRVGMVILCLTLGSLLLIVANHTLSLILIGSVLLLLGSGIAFVQSPSAVGASRSIQGQSGSSLGLFNAVRFSGAASGAAATALLLDTPLGMPGLFAIGILVALIALVMTFWNGKLL